jgi:hypothetical protein
MEIETVQRNQNLLYSLIEGPTGFKQKPGVALKD